ncbi:MAG TPA: asparaginase [Cerasibacillus sp.]|uniref:asparaginase n=1 Tax=Cerasibacillus sp. TaxID=2498711 RepID=UPI002F42133C
MKKIALFSMGGTISAKGKNRLDLKDYTSGKITGEELLDSLPEINQIAEVHPVQIDNISSTNLKEAHWLILQREVNRYLNELDFDGAVITQGTSTLEETAYYLHLTLATDKPVVLVGAQRPSSALSTDAPLNFLNAVRVATHEQSKGRGVLVVANDQISCARDVTKVNTYRVETFQSGELGHLGWVNPNGTVEFYREPTRKHTVHSIFTQLEMNQLPRIAIVYSYAGADGDLIDYISSTDSYDGLVIAGVGAGRFSRVEERAIRHAIEKGLHVVRSSRGGQGSVVDIAAYEGLRTIAGDNLTPQKARILLMLALCMTEDYMEIQRYFYEY